MSEDLQPFVEIQLQIGLDRTPQISSSPATSAAVRHRPAYRASRRKKEEIDVGIDLTHYAENHIEMEIKCLERNVGAKTRENFS